jgi:ATP-dependent helicase/nuclease subunit B
LSLRPQHFWTSDLDLLINNPYAFYAKKILKLVEIRSINELSRGNYVHNVLEDFIRYAANKKDINELRKIAQKVLKNKWLEPLDFGLWYFRLDKILSFVVKNMEEKKYYVEVRGSCFVNISEDYRVKLSSKADRIDVDQHGHISIIDYKTNTLPSKASVSDGRKIQLPLEAIIAQNAGFGLKETEVESLCYWELKNPSGDKNIMYVAKTLEEVQELTQKNLKILKDLIYKYNISGSAYDVDVDYPYEKSYMHLARVKEWNNV